MDPDNTSNFFVKIEPREEHHKIENISLDIPKLSVNMVCEGTEPKPKSELENQANENYIDQTYCKVPDTLLNTYEGLFPNQIEPLVKIENFEDMNNEVNFENWEIKNEPNIKEEGLEPKKNSMSPECVAPDEYHVSIADLKYHQNDDEEIHDRKAGKLTGQRTKRGHTNRKEASVFKCDHCQYETVKRCHINRHSQRHKNSEEVNTLKCPHCNYKTYLKHCLKTHLLRHAPAEEVETFRCDQCPFQTIYKSYLKQHYTHRHENPDNVLKLRCKWCLFQTIHKKSMQNHLLQHANPKQVERFECYHCKYKTIYKRDLKKHLLLHKRLEEIVSFACDRCGHQTTRIFHLKLHRRRSVEPEKVQMLQCNRCHHQVNREDHSNVE